MKIKLKNSAKRVLANVFSAKVDDGNALIPENIRKDVKIFDVVGTYGTAPVTPEDLVPFRVGQTVSGVTIDPNAKTNDEIVEWLNTFSIGAGEFTALLRSKEDTDSDRVMVGNMDGIKTLLFNITSDLFLYFVAEDVPGMMAKGWNIQDENNGNTITPVTEKTTFNGDVYEIATIADKFAFLNGTVFGAVEGEAPQETLTPFRVGQTIKGINFNSSLNPINGEKSTEMDNFLASLPYNDSGLYIFAEGILQDQDLDTEVAMVARKDNELYIFGNLINNSIFTVVYSTGITGMTGQEGWQNITDGTAMLNDGVTILINRIPDNSNNWNGTLIGAVEGEAPQETLTPFRTGQTVNGVTIDPTAKTDEEIVNWLNNLTNEQHLVEFSDGVSSVNGIAVTEINGNKTLTMFLTPISIVFFADAVSGDFSIPKGWSYALHSDNANFTPITERTTLNLDTLEVTQVYSEFDFLNGVVVGAVEATNVPDVPQETLTPFRGGQNITTIKVDTNARTNDELSTFASKVLEGQGDSKVLVSDNINNSLVNIQGSAESGYIITAASDTNNNIVWVSKGLDLEGKFTLPSAGWYLVNKNDSTFSETSGVVELPLNALINVGDSIDATFNSELNGVVFGVVEE